MSRRVRGSGGVYRRKDGRWEAKAYFQTVDGAARRLHLYGKTAKEASDKLTAYLAKASQGIPIPDRAWSINDYLDYYLRDIAPGKLRPKTLELYESVIRVHLKPMLAGQSLTRLSVTTLQRLLNDQLVKGKSLRTVRLIRTVLSAALTRAMREELVSRNVARLVELKMNRSKTVDPWSVEEAMRFLAAAQNDRLYPAYLMIMVYGMRRGEILGLRRKDIDWKNDRIDVIQQLQQIQGQLQIGPVKTDSGERALPLLKLVRTALKDYQDASADEPTNSDDLLFVTPEGMAIWPRNFVHRFHRICGRAGLRRIRLHDLRHLTATLLKNLGMPDRDIQLILGHANIRTTQQIYEHGNTSLQTAGLDMVSRVLLSETPDSPIGRQLQASKLNLVEHATTFVSGGTSGARTHDTLLKSLTGLGRDPALTPVIGQLHTRVNTHILGSIGVSLGVKIDSADCPDSPLWQWISLRDALAPQPRRLVDRLAASSTNARR